MNVEFDKSFLKSLDKIKDGKVLLKIEKIILSCEKASQLTEISGTKKLTGFPNYFRIRMGHYRIGFELLNTSTIRFIIVTHRKDIYKIFP
ncbi:type II toxin-antitoxin system RelE/ParE family toxin [Prolixibacteraceae bacterium Z1-6]|uniref:Type II toxin-antitoxin system RelE/ParE family toxin n=1 Tax=Draconibacterium aestuarii TaxID=2998507 RepID=A0A9X3J809_9BACT|nr:type II toxin-antitoxin system RelE/ParE family toxin [Prolixibacteraceae bacterium Z1-6]